MKREYRSGPIWFRESGLSFFWSFMGKSYFISQYLIWRVLIHLSAYGTVTVIITKSQAMTEYTFKEIHFTDHTKPAGCNHFTRLVVVSPSNYLLDYVGEKKSKNGSCLPPEEDLNSDGFSCDSWEDFHNYTNNEFRVWVETYSNEERREYFSYWLENKNKSNNQTTQLNKANELTVGKLIKAKEMLEASWTKYVNEQISLVPYIYGTTAQNKENKMCNTHHENTAEKDARRRLINRSNAVRTRALRKARKDFHIDDDTPPKTRQEIADRIANNLFVIEDLETSPNTPLECWSLPVNHIRWRDPALKEDKEGFDAKCIEIEKDHDRVYDSIYVKTPAEALVDFEAFAAKYDQ